MDEFDEPSAASRPKPSKTPSWIMLGFIFGALFVWALPRAKEQLAPVRVSPVVKPAAIVAAMPPRLSDIEAVFEEWGRYAVWADNTTYVCMWDLASRTFRDCYEVVRRGDAIFFRTVSRPRQWRTVEGIPSNSPLEFLSPIPETRGMFGERLSPPPMEPPPGLAPIK